MGGESPFEDIGSWAQGMAGPMNGGTNVATLGLVRIALAVSKSIAVMLETAAHPVGSEIEMRAETASGSRFSRANIHV